MAAEGQSDRMGSDMEVQTEQRCVIEFLHDEKMAPTGIHQHLPSSYGDPTVDVSTVKWWVVCFSRGNSKSGSPLLVQMFTSMECRVLFTTDENAYLMVMTSLKNSVL